MPDHEFFTGRDSSLNPKYEYASTESLYLGSIQTEISNTITSIYGTNSIYNTIIGVALMSLVPFVQLGEASESHGTIDISLVVKRNTGLPEIFSFHELRDLQGI